MHFIDLRLALDAIKAGYKNIVGPQAKSLLKTAGIGLSLSLVVGVFFLVSERFDFPLNSRSWSELVSMLLIFIPLTMHILREGLAVNPLPFRYFDIFKKGFYKERAAAFVLFFFNFVTIALFAGIIYGDLLPSKILFSLLFLLLVGMLLKIIDFAAGKSSPWRALYKTALHHGGTLTLVILFTLIVPAHLFFRVLYLIVHPFPVFSHLENPLLGALILALVTYISLAFVGAVIHLYKKIILKK